MAMAGIGTGVAVVGGAVVGATVATVVLSLATAPASAGAVVVAASVAVEVGASGPALPAMGVWALRVAWPAWMLRSTAPACVLALARPTAPTRMAPDTTRATHRVVRNRRSRSSPVDRHSPLNHRWMTPLRMGRSMNR